MLCNAPTHRHSSSAAARAWPFCGRKANSLPDPQTWGKERIAHLVCVPTQPEGAVSCAAVEGVTTERDSIAIVLPNRRHLSFTAHHRVDGELSRTLSFPTDMHTKGVQRPTSSFGCHLARDWPATCILFIGLPPGLQFMRKLAGRADRGNDGLRKLQVGCHGRTQAHWGSYKLHALSLDEWEEGKSWDWGKKFEACKPAWSSMNWCSGGHGIPSARDS
ncbi:hypothetical protein DFH27DRAFT_201269 [Peziza echinospora]|nr:hypothetical protein DFH27DRAFT_201269 [Peziza echinospora]